jgi:tRNA-(ms[2]io[6]A)-hydroxylase
MSKRMLSLKLPTDPRWTNIVEKDLYQILCDHAFAEHKAASTAMSLIMQYPELTELVQEMIGIAQEEMEHFEEVMEHITARGWHLGPAEKDPYVADLKAFFPKGGRDRTGILVDKLLVAAMIEARSCERFRVLADNISDPELSEFYRRLMKSEAGHYSTFLLFAKKYGGEEEVSERWASFLQHEGEVIAKYGKTSKIHG